MSRSDSRLLGLLAMLLGLSGLSPLALCLYFLLMIWAAYRLQAVTELWRRSLRLRWFFLAIFLLYLWGQPTIDEQPDWAQAGYRVGVLIGLLGAVSISLWGVPASELGSSLYRALRPLVRFGFPAQSFATRLAGTLDAIGTMDSALRGLQGRGLAQAMDGLATVCLDAERHAISADTRLVRGAVTTRTDAACLLAVGLTMLALQWL